jgi:hypothetical protein
VTAPQYDQTIPAVAHGGRFDPDPPAFDVIHSTEGPMSDGNAEALARNWFGRPKSEGGAGTSTTGIFDPIGSVRMLDEHTIPYHVGPEGNPISTGDEHCGSVNLTPEQWMSERGQAMLDASAKVKAQRAIFRGWSLADCRWLTLTEVARRTVRGFCTHNDVRLALGGTTHSDPGKNFPYAWYIGRIRYWFQVLTGTLAPDTLEEIMGLYDTAADYESGTRRAVAAGVRDALRDFLPRMTQAADGRPNAVFNGDAVAETPGKVVELLTEIAENTTPAPPPAPEPAPAPEA